MDTSKKRILMCGNAKEVQENHQWQIGELVFLDMEDGIIALVTKVDQDGYDWIPLQTAVGTIMDDGEDIWLPRQDQLQAMVYEKSSEQSKFPHIAKFSMFWWGFPNCVGVAGIVNGKEKVTLPYLDYFDSMEQLWLGFVMKQLHSKVWSETKKDWVHEKN